MTEYQGQTDETTEVELPSAIEQVQWSRDLSIPGGTVVLDVSTSFIGNGAKLEIVLSDRSGKKFGGFKEKIFGDRYRASIRVPDKARDALFAEVKLPKHGLKQKSPALLLMPPIQITNAKWSSKEARRGDVLKLTADIDGVPDGTEVEISILEHDNDGAHDLITTLSVLVKNRKVETEWEYEYHEDTDEIPTEEEAAKGYNPPEYFFRVRVNGIYADSDLLEFKDWVELELVDHDGNAFSGEAYVLYLPDGKQRKGNLDANGKLKEEAILPGRFHIEFPEIDKNE